MAAEIESRYEGIAEELEHLLPEKLLVYLHGSQKRLHDALGLLEGPEWLMREATASCLSFKETKSHELAATVAEFVMRIPGPGKLARLLRDPTNYVGIFGFDEGEFRERWRAWASRDYASGQGKRYDDEQDHDPDFRGDGGGELYVLMNGGSFSSTGHLLALLKYQEIGTFIGQFLAGKDVVMDFALGLVREKGGN